MKKDEKVTRAEELLTQIKRVKNDVDDFLESYTNVDPKLSQMIYDNFLIIQSDFRKAIIEIKIEIE